jgi:hypothetical protein
MNNKILKINSALLLVSLALIITYYLNENNKIKGGSFFKKENTVFVDLDSKINKIINSKSGFDSDANFYNDSIVIRFENLKLVYPKEKPNVNSTNISFRSSLYSLSFLRDAILNNKLNENTSKIQLDKINNFIEELYSDNSSILFMDKLFYSDHPVAERIETLILYYNFLTNINKYEKFQKYILNRINELANLLKQDFYFTFNTNHGLMQLRALMSYSILTNNEDLQAKINEKINEIIPIFFANDGSVLESATGYHYYIINQFKILQILNNIANINNNNLNNILVKTDYYLNTILTKEGFLQGMGDSYNFYIDSIYSDTLNYIYNYGNGIAGINLKSQNYNFMFVSLDNKPTVHKLPEDLSLFLYYKEPYFINTGSYSYNDVDVDVDRKYINPVASQQGVHFINQKADSSVLFLNYVRNKQFYFTGKIYSKEKYITRNIYISSNSLTISDTSTSNFISRYNINPKIKTTVIDSNSVYLIGKNDTLIFNSKNKISIDTSWIAFSFMTKTKIVRLNIHNSNKVKIYFPNINLNIDTIINNNKDYQRLKQYNLLKYKYSKHYYHQIKRVLFLMLILGFLVIIILFFMKNKRLANYLALLLNFMLIFYMFFDYLIINFIISILLS